MHFECRIREVREDMANLLGNVALEGISPRQHAKVRNLVLENVFIT